MGVTTDLGPVQGMPPTQLQMAMTISDTTGSISYNKESDSAFINWDLANDTNARTARYLALQKIADHSGGFVLPDSQLGRINMWHPLGGAIMGEAVDQDTGFLFSGLNFLC